MCLRGVYLCSSKQEGSGGLCTEKWINNTANIGWILPMCCVPCTYYLSASWENPGDECYSILRCKIRSMVIIITVRYFKHLIGDRCYAKCFTCPISCNSQNNRIHLLHCSSPCHKAGNSDIDSYGTCPESQSHR